MIYLILPSKAEEGWIKPDQCHVNSTWIELTYYIETLVKSINGKLKRVKIANDEKHLPHEPKPFNQADLLKQIKLESDQMEKNQNFDSDAKVVKPIKKEISDTDHPIKQELHTKPAKSRKRNDRTKKMKKPKTKLGVEEVRKKDKLRKRKMAMCR